MYTQSMIYNGNENPIYSHTLEEFINAGDVSSAPTFDTWCFAEKSNNIHYCVKNVIDDYLPELKGLSTHIYLNDEELRKYNYKPKLLSADVYGSTDLYYLILLLNGICNVKEFKDINPILLISKSDMFSFISDIIRGERSSIEEYNSIHLKNKVLRVE